MSDDMNLDHADLVKCESNVPSAIARKNGNKWEIWLSLARPDIVIGSGDTEASSWESAWDYICDIQAV